jgi:hypothetical protein
LDTLVSSDILNEEVDIMDEDEEIYQYIYTLKEEDLIKDIISKDVEASKKIESAINQLKGLRTSELVKLSKDISKLYSIG